MAKFPEPPSTLTIAPLIKTVPSGTVLWRIYFMGGAHPVSWDQFRYCGPTASRFDHHDPPKAVQSKGIMYCASAPVTCLAEVFQATRVIDRSAGEPWLAGFAVAADLHLLDLTGPWPTQAGASMAINTGHRPRAQRWSRILYKTYPMIDGIYYPSSMHANSPSAALFERAVKAIPSAPSFNRALIDPALLGRLGSAAGSLGYRLV
jgi:hypothetical protein